MAYKSQPKLSNMQWYLARAHNIVFVALKDTNIKNHNEFKNFLRHLVSLDERMAWMGNLDAGTAQYGGLDYVLENSRFKIVDDVNIALDELLTNIEVPFKHGTKPWLYAHAFRQVNSDKSLVFIATPHSLMEGIDSARLLRGMHPQPLPIQRFKIGGLISAVIYALPAFFVFIGHHILARRKEAASIKLKQHKIIIDRNSLKKSAKKNGATTRQFLFASILDGLQSEQDTQKGLSKSLNRRRSKKTLLAYSYYSSNRRWLDDNAIKLQMDFINISFGSKFADTLKNCIFKLNKPHSQVFSIQHLNNLAIGIHRRISRVIPKLYSPDLFQYIPADFLLTLLPPNRLTWPNGILDNAKLHTGSNAPGINSCIICPQKNDFLLALNLDTENASKLENLVTLFENNGVQAKLIR